MSAKITQPRCYRNPEMRDGEMFAGNFTKEEFEKSAWRTKRLGSKPYFDEQDRRITDPSILPVFVGQMEVAEYLNKNPHKEATREFMDYINLKR